MSAEIKYKGSVVSSVSAGESATLHCNGNKLTDDIVIESTVKGDMEITENGTYDVADKESVTVAVEAPFFDLVEMGLPTVKTDGTTSDLTLDTTEMRTALDSGVAKFALDVDGSGKVEVTMGACVTDGLYLCTCTVLNLTLTLMIAENAIQASAAASVAVYNGEVEVV